MKTNNNRIVEDCLVLIGKCYNTRPPKMYFVLTHGRHVFRTVFWPGSSRFLLNSYVVHIVGFLKYCPFLKINF